MCMQASKSANLKIRVVIRSSGTYKCYALFALGPLCKGSRCHMATCIKRAAPQGTQSKSRDVQLPPPPIPNFAPTTIRSHYSHPPAEVPQGTRVLAAHAAPRARALCAPPRAAASGSCHCQWPEHTFSGRRTSWRWTPHPPQRHTRRRSVDTQYEMQRMWRQFLCRALGYYIVRHMAHSACCFVLLVCVSTAVQQFATTLL